MRSAKRMNKIEYQVDLATLLQILGQSTGTLAASAASIPQGRGRYTVRLELVQGVVIKSILFNEEGRERAFPTAQAVEFLKDQTLIWVFSPIAVPKTEPPPSSSVSQNIYRRLRRVRQVSQQEFSSWPLAYQQVYSLINDSISLERLQALLAHSPKEATKIEYIVIAFLQKGYIAYSDPAPQ